MVRLSSAGHPALPQDQSMSIYGDIEAICQPKSFDFLSKNGGKDEF
jgi:hypothetical protein